MLPTCNALQGRCASDEELFPFVHPVMTLSAAAPQLRQLAVNAEVLPMRTVILARLFGTLE